ncbi:MAG: thiamine pyrophosphate-dependent enzyme [Bacteroidota bacterium]
MELDTKQSIEGTTTIISKEEALADYFLAYKSREASLIGRREVLSGKAKFGIFGDGKELPQIAMAKAFQKGDYRSGYYRDQTFALATGIQTMDQFFAQLYANPNLEEEPNSGGRQMNAHFASRNLDAQGKWVSAVDLYNTSADGSPTASQMPRLVGLAQASKLYRQLDPWPGAERFSRGGNEVAFGTIGNASTAEGHFWEAINAMGVLQVPVVMSIWDDEYGISVPNEYQITKRSLSEMLSGFQRTEEDRGYEIFQVKAWDYEGLIDVYLQAAAIARTEHVPCIIHVVEVTQPQGHSTSGSHERYKSKERLDWERAHDCVQKMRAYILEKGYIEEEKLAEQEKAARKEVRGIKNTTWKNFQAPILVIRDELASIVQPLAEVNSKVGEILQHLQKDQAPKRRTAVVAAHQIILAMQGQQHPALEELKRWYQNQIETGRQIYSSHITSQSDESPLSVQGVAPIYSSNPEQKSGFEILNTAFDRILERHPEVVAFGEDVGQLGDVNQGFAGMQAKYGVSRVTDTGIREATIIGQAIGLASRGFRPIAEIQYLDYFIYGLQTMSDDLATLQYRTRGGQKAPAIIRTRGHRLEGIWHAGSPLGMMIHALRGIHIAVPRDMTRAVGFYHTLLAGDDPGVIVEVLNGYRLKEDMPDNLHDIQLPLGVPDVMIEGTDVTLVTYGACVRIAEEAIAQLAEVGISVELIDVQTLLPFDVNGKIRQSLEKTNRIVFLDEDVPGGATSYMMQEVLEKQEGYYLLDSQPKTITSQAHRPAFGDDGDYWSKPQVETVFHTVYELMNEVDPHQYPAIFN